jgi:hypothetical protein
MRTRSSPRRQSAIYCIMTAALCWTAFLNLNSPYTSAILVMSAEGPDNPLAGIDAFIRRATTHGNALVLFQGFSPQLDKDDTFISRIYFRGDYIAYPRRVFVCDDSDRFDPRQIAARPFAPDDSWMKKHGIRCVLTFIATPGKDLQSNLREI